LIHERGTVTTTRHRSRNAAHSWLLMLLLRWWFLLLLELPLLLGGICQVQQIVLESWELFEGSQVELIVVLGLQSR